VIVKHRPIHLIELWTDWRYSNESLCAYLLGFRHYAQTVQNIQFSVLYDKFKGFKTVKEWAPRPIYGQSQVRGSFLELYIGPARSTRIQLHRLLCVDLSIAYNIVHRWCNGGDFISLASLIYGSCDKSHI